MSIFGKLDAANVKANPNHIDTGDYEGEVTWAGIRTNESGDRRLVIEYTIENEESAFNGSKHRETFFLPAEDMTEEQMLLLPVEDQKKIRKNNANVKKRLCGYSAKNIGLGVSEDDLNDPNWTPEVLKGLKVRFGIQVNGDYINTKYVVLQD